LKTVLDKKLLKVRLASPPQKKKQNHQKANELMTLGSISDPAPGEAGTLPPDNRDLRIAGRPESNHRITEW